MDENVAEGRMIKASLVREDRITKTLFVNKRPLNNAIAYRVRFRILNGDTFFLDPWFKAVLIRADKVDDLSEINDYKVNYSFCSELFTGDLSIIDVDNSNRSRHPEIYTLGDISIFKEADGEFYIEAVRFGKAEEALDADYDYYIAEFYSDLNSGLLTGRLSAINADIGETYSRLNLLYPVGRGNPEDGLYRDFAAAKDDATVDDSIREALAGYEPYDAVRDELMELSHPDGYSFTPSQLRAFEQFYRANLTLLLGPPGTGKTDFIARAIITLVKFYKSRGKALRVLVTANSGAAIDNILEKIAEKLGDTEDAFEVFRMYTRYTDYLNKLEQVEEGKSLVDPMMNYRPFRNEDEMYAFNEIVDSTDNDDVSFVVGATCWAVTRGSQKAYGYSEFDVVVIDEASQVRTQDALLTLSMMNAGTGRMLIVGDENQLAPIIKGKYEAPEDEIDIYASIFRLYYQTYMAMTDEEKKAKPYLRQLEENFRMNEVLDRYPARAIYDVDITPAMRASGERNGYHAYLGESGDDYSIARQLLSLDIDEDDYEDEQDDILKYITNSAYPMVLIKLSGDSAADKSEAERRLATEITAYMYEHMLDKDGGHVSDRHGEDADVMECFWGHEGSSGAYAIVSPHHEHINKLKDKISGELHMASGKLFIGTVDKLQGQEREAVLVSYGISDVERAVSESEFIYSRNRLNVAITRAKKKMICILTDALLDKPIETLEIEDEDTILGISFMCGLESFMRRSEEDTECTYAEFELDGIDGVKVEVLRKRVRV